MARFSNLRINDCNTAIKEIIFFMILYYICHLKQFAHPDGHKREKNVLKQYKEQETCYLDSSLGSPPCYGKGGSSYGGGGMVSLSQLHYSTGESTRFTDTMFGYTPRVSFWHHSEY